MVKRIFFQTRQRLQDEKETFEKSLQKLKTRHDEAVEKAAEVLNFLKLLSTDAASNIFFYSQDK